MNYQIRVKEVRVINPDGVQLGVMQTDEAVRLAKDLGYDLVEVAPGARPPVCRIIDFGKFKYEQKKKLHQAKRHQTTMQIKEVKLRPTTEEHDLQVKLKNIFRFLEEGDKAKVTMCFRGREIAYHARGRAIMDRISKELEGHTIIDQPCKMEGRSLIMIFAPSKGRAKEEEKGSA